MPSYIPMQAGAVPIHAIVQDALRAAVHAPSEREGFDLLADALRKVSESALFGRHAYAPDKDMTPIAGGPDQGSVETENGLFAETRDA